MSNVVSIGLPKRPNLAQRQGALLQSFACHRRTADDVFWLKENAELLNVLATGGAKPRPRDLEVYRGFYDSLEERMRFFPQYYRFLLSICLDLEDLGMAGDTGRALCARVHDLDLAAGELSDLQRAEAQRLLARRGYGELTDDLEKRLHAFIEQTETFSLPNKKAAYELTHIVFYLSDYGAQPLRLSEAAVTSLEYAGLLAFLDQDLDLLSEVCVALRFAGETPSDIWEDWLAGELNGFILAPVPAGPVNDAYHEYFVASWWAGIAGMTGFPGVPSAAGMEVMRSHPSKGPLRALSELMYQLGPARSGDWNRMRGLLHRCIAAEHHHILDCAAQSSQRFDAFFEGFSRVN
jgi:hypothetical protein